MAIHRTKKDKIKATQRREQTINYSFSEEKPLAVQSQKVDRVASQNNSKANSQSEKSNNFNQSFYMQTQATAIAMKKDLFKTLIVTLIMVAIILGIWYLTRYNGLSV